MTFTLICLQQINCDNRSDFEYVMRQKQTAIGDFEIITTLNRQRLIAVYSQAARKSRY